MIIAYFDCFSGISGDMTLGALIACGVNTDTLISELGKLKLPGWSMRTKQVQKSGIGAVSVTVELAEPPRHGRHLPEIEGIISQSELSDRVKSQSLQVFRRLADAEANVHQTTPDKIHFHEVGAIDAIVDIVGSCLALEMLGVDVIRSSPLPMGRGFIECAHGIIPLPAPAVLELVKGFPVIHQDVEGELVTPTGAALITTLAQREVGYGEFHARQTGYGAGKRDFNDRPNLLRVTIGESAPAKLPTDKIALLETNIDDLSPQFYAPLMERLFEGGALDVFLTPVYMKKNRPGVLLNVICPPVLEESCARIIFEESSAIGVRRTLLDRYCLKRDIRKVSTPWGDVRMKIAYQGEKALNVMPEFEDVRRIAKESGIPVKTVHETALYRYRESGNME
jgi:uncharacterized protein (TIGR00299 family) protein